MFVHESPLPSVEIPDVSLTEYVLANAAEQATMKVATSRSRADRWPHGSSPYLRPA